MTAGHDLAIRAEDLGKRYVLARVAEPYRTLRDSLRAAALAPWRRLAAGLRGEGWRTDPPETLWALQGLGFEIRAGEVVGIIGRNGAGKSTLLKILSRITEPTTGWAEIRGRIGSLLEVGTGFHQELTGRENTYLSGAILGMRRAEIHRKFDEIVEFAEIGRFIDTPVKRYSSGMYTRLAFAVAAHLDPEILIVDEVLAVGDARFQKKCLAKMSDVGQQGRTVLFVSHNMGAIARLCQRVLLLDAGRLVKDGPAHEVVATYLHGGLGTTAVREWADGAIAPGGDIARLRAVRILGDEGSPAEAIDIRQPVHLQMEYEVLRPGVMLMPHFHVSNEEGIHVFSLHDVDPAWRNRPRPAGIWKSTVTIPGNFLSEGALFVSAGLITLNPVSTQFYERDAVAFRVVDSFDSDTARGDYPGRMTGVVRPLLPWRTDVTPRGSSRVAASVGRK